MYVTMTDARPGAAAEAREFVAKMLARAAEKGSMTQDQANAAANRIRIAESLAEFSDCHVVIEAIVENLDAKRELCWESSHREAHRQRARATALRSGLA